MSRPINSRSFAIIAIFFSLAGTSLASSHARIVPAKGESLSFKRSYSRKHLAENQPYQLLAKTKFTLKNSGGLLTGTWSGSVRDISRGEEFEASATGICKARSAQHVECNFGSGVEAANIFARKDGVLVSIPLGYGVLFRAPEKDGMIRQEFIFGADEENKAYRLYR